MAEIVYKWKVKETVRHSGWCVLSWRMTENDAAQWAASEGSTLEKIEGSEEVRRDLGNTSALMGQRNT